MKQPGGSKRDFFRAVEGKLNDVIRDLISTRVAFSQAAGDFNDRIAELRRESTAMSLALGALLDLLADLTNMPMNVLASRYSQLVEERSIVKSNGQVAGEVSFEIYNF